MPILQAQAAGGQRAPWCLPERPSGSDGTPRRLKHSCSPAAQVKGVRESAPREDGDVCIDGRGDGAFRTFDPSFFRWLLLVKAKEFRCIRTEHSAVHPHERQLDDTRCASEGARPLEEVRATVRGVSIRAYRFGPSAAQ